MMTSVTLKNLTPSSQGPKNMLLLTCHLGKSWVWTAASEFLQFRVLVGTMITVLFLLIVNIDTSNAATRKQID